METDGAASMRLSGIDGHLAKRSVLDIRVCSAGTDARDSSRLGDVGEEELVRRIAIQSSAEM
jgi:hypothetical protein